MKEFARLRLRSAPSAATAALLSCAALTCAQSAPPVPSASAAFREVTDEVGRTVRVPQPVRRIVSLAPSLTETVYALGLQDHLVGDTDYCDYPADARKKTKVSSYATDPHTVEEIITSSKKLSEVLGVPEAGASVAGEMQRRLADLQQRVGALAAKRVLFVVWTQPLISVGKATFIADALRRAGAVSIVDSEQNWPQVSLEEVARLQPEFLVFADSHSDSASPAVEMLATLPGWSILDAVNNRRFAVISDAVNRPAPRIVTAIEDLAKQLHPDAFVEKPENGKEKMEKENPPPNQRPASRYSFSPDFLQVRMTIPGGRACAR